MSNIDSKIDYLEKELTYLRFEKQKYLVKSNTLLQNIKELKFRIRVFIFLFIFTFILLISEIFFINDRFRLNLLKLENNNETKILYRSDSLNNTNLNNLKEENKTGVYRIQIGLFESLKDKKSLNHKIEGIHIIEKDKGKTLCIGSFYDKNEAIKFCKILRRRGFYDVFVIYDESIK